MAHSAIPPNLQDNHGRRAVRRRAGHRRNIIDDRHLILRLPEEPPVTEAEINLVLGTLGATIAAILGGDE